MALRAGAERKQNEKRAAEAAINCPFLPLQEKAALLCNPMMALVAGGGFEPPTFGL